MTPSETLLTGAVQPQWDLEGTSCPVWAWSNTTEWSQWWFWLYDCNWCLTHGPHHAFQLGGWVAMGCCSSTACYTNNTLERNGPWVVWYLKHKLSSVSYILFFFFLKGCLSCGTWQQDMLLNFQLAYSSNRLGLVGQNVISSCEKYLCSVWMNH